MKKPLLLSALLAAALYTLAAPAVTLKWAAQNDVLTLDPHSQNHTPSISIQQHCYEALVRYDQNFQLEPGLATSWQQISPTQWPFNLRKGVDFHDGSAFAADGVAFSYGRILQPQGNMQVYVNVVKEVRKIDDATVDFILDGPNPVFLRNLTIFSIMSKTWAEKTKSQNIQNFKDREETFASRNTNGTGSYMIKGWEPDKRIVLVANPEWWGKRDGNVTEVIYTPIKSDSTRVAALLAGDVDMVTDLPTQDVARLRSDPKLKVIDGAENRSIFIGLDQFNSELQYSNVKGKNPFKDQRVRHAVNVAVDREAIKRVTMRGLSIPAGLMVAPQIHPWSQDIDKVAPFNTGSARKLLAEAGFPNGFHVTLDCPNNRYVDDEEICQALVSMWARAGLKVKLNAMPFATYIPKLLKLDTSAYMLGWGVPTFDAQFMLQALVHTKTTGADGSFNQGRISDPKLDQMIAAMKVEFDVKKRDALMREALVMG